MKSQQLIGTAQALVADDKGLLAMDESTPTCNKRFAKLGIPQTEEARRSYRELLITCPGLGKSISGAILYDETIRQKTREGRPFIDVLLQTGIVPGIKVDLGAKAMAGFAGERVTEGLDGLASRVREYVQMGARFAKWRAVIAIDSGAPTEACIDANAHALARYARICQEGGLVPIIEPEVLMSGSHDLQRCFEVTGQVLHWVFDQLHRQQVLLEGMILKPNMVLPGKDCPRQATLEQIADATIKCLLREVPAAVPGIAFLSGGQSSELASFRLNAMNNQSIFHVPWALTFSFGRAIQRPALQTWAGEAENVKSSLKALIHRAECNRAARQSKYDSAMESLAPNIPAISIPAA